MIILNFSNIDRVGCYIKRESMASKLFLEGWAADLPGVRQARPKHCRKQLVGRIVSFAKARGADSVDRFARRDLQGFVVWLDESVDSERRSPFAGADITKDVALPSTP